MLYRHILQANLRVGESFERNVTGRRGIVGESWSASVTHSLNPFTWGKTPSFPKDHHPHTVWMCVCQHIHPSEPNPDSTHTHKHSRYYGRPTQSSYESPRLPMTAQGIYDVSKHADSGMQMCTFREHNCITHEIHKHKHPPQHKCPVYTTLCDVYQNKNRMVFLQARLKMLMCLWIGKNI